MPDEPRKMPRYHAIAWDDNGVLAMSWTNKLSMDRWLRKIKRADGQWLWIVYDSRKKIMLFSIDLVREQQLQVTDQTFSKDQ
jgi:hypothetical protein